ncbi:MAG TPA: hypothetical protein VNQ79_27240 [Blastocatellia bacterium]|nr:hypothetical protein [Blastocatellia bacterium]
MFHTAIFTDDKEAGISALIEAGESGSARLNFHSQFVAEETVTHTTAHCENGELKQRIEKTPESSCAGLLRSDALKPVRFSGL